MTPGPWHVCSVRPDQYPMVRAADGHVVADCSRIAERTIEEQKTNAKLIAAAPALLEALTRLLAYANRYSDEMSNIGRGAEELGELASSDSVAGMALRAIRMAMK